MDGWLGLRKFLHARLEQGGSMERKVDVGILLVSRFWYSTALLCYRDLVKQEVKSIDY